jgi:hypothetical protein
MTLGMRLWFAILLSAIGYAWLGRMESANGLASVARFWSVMIGLFALTFWAWTLIGRRMLLLWSGAVLFRILLLPAGLPDPVLSGAREDWSGQDSAAYDRSLLFDHDVWRYLWDGHVASHGVSPYAHPPRAEELDSHADSARWEAIRANVNHPHLRTLYPPVAQFAFRLAYALAPGSVLAMKLVLSGFDLAGAVFLWLVLEDRRKSAVIWYAWNPLVIKAFAGSAHVDSVVVCLLAAMFYFAGRRWAIAAGAAFGLAVAAKLSPLLLFPAAVRFLGWRVAMGGLILAAGLLAPLASEPRAASGLTEYARYWRFNGGFFNLAAAIFGESGARLGITALIAAISLWAGHASSFARAATRALGGVLLFSPAVMPWYVPWILPGAILAGRWAWVGFSLLVLAAFAVMIDQHERPWLVGTEFGVMALLLWWESTRERGKITC